MVARSTPPNYVQSVGIRTAGATPATSPSRHGFTLIESLVVIAVIGILLRRAAAGPPVPRQSALRASCTNNLRQIGQALHSYDGALGCFPPGRIRTHDPRQLVPGFPPCSGPVDRSFLIAILPQVEQVPLYDSFNLSLWILAPENTTRQAVLIGVYICPSDSEASRLRRSSRRL